MDRATLMERLRSRLGDAALHGLSRWPDHRPECAWRRLPAAGIVRSGARARGEHQDPERGVESSARTRPLWLVEVPRMLAVDQGAPLIDGARLRLLRGPERIESGWWETGVARDYWLAAGPQGMRYWIYHERHGARGWYLHGLFA